MVEIIKINKTIKVKGSFFILKPPYYLNTSGEKFNKKEGDSSLGFRMTALGNFVILRTLV
jgi:hypothetical protein